MDIADRSSEADAGGELNCSDHPALTAVLGSGQLEILGRLRQASNQTFLARFEAEAVVDHGVAPAASDVLQAVYKPLDGERPLWDFPQRTLGFREVAAYRLSQLGGFDVVPVTVLVDGPFGLGSMQVWVDSVAEEVDQLVDIVPIDQVPDRGWFPIVEGYAADDRPIAVIHADDPRLRLLAVFDALINNADRKGGHILASHGRVFGVDHGICFHTEDKLRTLLWGWAGQPLQDHERSRIQRVADGAIETLDGLLSEAEIEALLLRAEGLLINGRLPLPDSDWHTIPWPPF
jgi:uncharacterized repeat protein (TIGR03843 family)